MSEAHIWTEQEKKRGFELYYDKIHGLVSFEQIQKELPFLRSWKQLEGMCYRQRGKLGLKKAPPEPAGFKAQSLF